MTRVNQPDSLLTELRDIKRRLRALETRSAALAPAPAAASAADVPETEEPRADKAE
ncbi:hypothetical protein [Amycolatopsis sp. WAC 01376]|uniref:hypothetical protein n=1 Tax=unclassified Amycolatopsis TaxID=2618356 RepID=UPI0013150842|nr:hypothetical protein [Amycolatopsis sp. WAC 01376]